MIMTAKFKFKLESVLNLKRFKQDLLQQDLANLLTELESEVSKLDDFYCRFEGYKQMLKSELSGNINSMKIQFTNEYLRLIEVKISEQKKIIKAINEVIKEKKKKLLQAQKERKIIQKLKDRHLDEYKKDIKLKFQKDLDDLSSKSKSLSGGILNGAEYSN